MSTTETQLMLNRHEDEIESMVTRLRPCHEAEGKEVERLLAEMDRKFSPRSQMHASLVGMYAKGTLPQ